MKSGYSLLEMVIVLGIITLILTASVGIGRRLLDHGKTVTTKAALKQVDVGLMAYEASSGRFPSDKQGLNALVQKPESGPKPRNWKPVLEEVPRDGWKQDFGYKSRVNGALKPEVRSSGSDGSFGTDDDLSNLRSLSQ